MFFARNSQMIHTDSIQSILLRLPNWLGDSVMVSPAFEWLKLSFKNADFTLVGTEASCGIYQRDKRVKHIVIDTTKRSSCRIQATKRLAKEVGAHDLAISFANTFFSALLLYWTKSNIRIGYAKNLRSFLLTHALSLKQNTSITFKHQVLLYLGLILPLQGVQNELEKKELQRQESQKQSLKNLTNMLATLGSQPLKLISQSISLPHNKYAIGINPGAAFGSAKCWEREYFIEVIEYFLGKMYDVYLFGSSDTSNSHLAIAQAIAGHTYAKHFYDLTDKTNLTQLIDYIGAMNVFITNDSGPMHIAAALKVPMVAIFGPTDMNETAPYIPLNPPVSNNQAQPAKAYKDFVLLCKHVPCAPCKKRECPLKHHNCMKLITPAEVITQVDNLLNYHKGNNYDT